MEKHNWLYWLRAKFARGIMRSVLAATTVASLVGTINALASDAPISISVYGGQTVTVIPYLATGYRYLVVNNGQAPAGFEQPNFDDSAFPIGDAAFGSSGSCPLASNVVTAWPINTDIVLRKKFTLLPGATGLKVAVAIDNDIQVFVNGVDISGGLRTHSFCASTNSFIFSAPDSILNSGENLVAVLGRDQGGQSYLDIQVTVEIPVSTSSPTPTSTDTPTSTPTDMPTPTPTETSTNTPTDTLTPTPTDTPTPTQTDTPTPSNPSMPPIKVTGGGQIPVPEPTSNGKATFGFNADQNEAGSTAATGHLNYVNHDTGLHINGSINDIQVIATNPDGSPKTVQFSGTCEGPGPACTFIVTLEDHGEPGTEDEFGITVTGDVTESQSQRVISQGNIQFHIR